MRKRSIPHDFSYGATGASGLCVASVPSGLRREVSFNSTRSLHVVRSRNLNGTSEKEWAEIDILHDFHQPEDNSPTFSTEYLVEHLDIEEPSWWCSCGDVSETSPLQLAVS